MNKTQKRRYLYLLKYDRYLEGSCPDSLYCDQFRVCLTENGPTVMDSKAHTT